MHERCDGLPIQDRLTFDVSCIVWVCRVTPNAFKCGRIIKLSDYQVPALKRAGRSCYNADYLGMGPRTGGGAGIINYQPGPAGRPAGRGGAT